MFLSCATEWKLAFGITQVHAQFVKFLAELENPKFSFNGKVQRFIQLLFQVFIHFTHCINRRSVGSIRMTFDEISTGKAVKIFAAEMKKASMSFSELFAS
jgi:hypothetical protein